jgi:hypothetical protein
MADVLKKSLKGTGIENELHARIHDVITDNKGELDETIAAKTLVAVREYFEHINCVFIIPEGSIQRQNVRKGKLI